MRRSDACNAVSRKHRDDSRLEESHGITSVATALVDGPTLAAKLEGRSRGGQALPIADAIAIARLPVRPTGCRVDGFPGAATRAVAGPARVSRGPRAVFTTGHVFFVRQEDPLFSRSTLCECSSPAKLFDGHQSNERPQYALLPTANGFSSTSHPAPSGDEASVGDTKVRAIIPVNAGIAALECAAAACLRS